MSSPAELSESSNCAEDQHEHKVCDEGSVYETSEMSNNAAQRHIECDTCKEVLAINDDDDTELCVWDDTTYCTNCIRCVYLGDTLATKSFSATDFMRLNANIDDDYRESVSFSPRIEGNSDEWANPIATQALAIMMRSRLCTRNVDFAYVFTNMSLRDGPTLHVSSNFLDLRNDMFDTFTVPNDRLRIVIVDAESNNVLEVNCSSLEDGQQFILEIYARFNGFLPFVETGARNYGDGYYPDIENDFVIRPQADLVVERIGSWRTWHVFACIVEGYNVCHQLSIRPPA